MFNHLTNTDMIAVANNSVVVINNLTSRRASVIARRTNSEAMGVIKAQMIATCHGFVELLLAHLYHFLDIAYLQVKQTEEGNAHYYA